MGKSDELDNLLKTIRENHFQTIHQLSGLYKKAETLIEKIKNDSSQEIDEELNNVRNLLSESVDIRDKQTEFVTEYLKSFIGFTNNDSSEKSSDKLNENQNSPADSLINSIPFLKIDKGDTDKLINIAATGSQAVLDIFSRMGQLFIEENEKKKDRAAD